MTTGRTGATADVTKWHTTQTTGLLLQQKSCYCWYCLCCLCCLCCRKNKSAKALNILLLSTLLRFQRAHHLHEITQGVATLYPGLFHVCDGSAERAKALITAGYLTLLRFGFYDNRDNRYNGLILNSDSTFFMSLLIRLKSFLNWVVWRISFVISLMR